MMLKALVVCSCITFMTTWTVVQSQQYTTPVPILKQINRQNEDGSYSYGYEGADGSFKIETKYATGEVYGKYGYVDENGKTREVEYGASRRGFEPQGSDINVPPPTLTNSNPYPVGPNDVDDGQYHEDPSVYYKNEKFSNAPRLPASNFRLNNLKPNPIPPPQQPPQQNQYYNPGPVYRPQPTPPRQQSPQQNQYYNPGPVYRPQPTSPPVQHRFQQQPSYNQQQPSYNQQPQQQQYYQRPQQNNYYNNGPVQHHPALRNIDIGSGSYSIDYTGRRR